MTRLVLVGGGHAHIEVLRRFGLQREPGAEITLINTSRHTVYSGMLPGLVAGHYGWRACFIDLEVLARLAGARLLRDIAVGLDLERKLVRCADAAEVPYHIASVDVGSAPNTPAVPQSERQPIAVRPVQICSLTPSRAGFWIDPDSSPDRGLCGHRISVTFHPCHRVRGPARWQRRRRGRRDVPGNTA